MHLKRQCFINFFLILYFCIVFCNPLQATALLVDISADTGDPLQEGYLDFHGGSEQTTPVSFTYASDFSIDGNLTVEISGNTHYRDYSPISSTNFLYPMSNLLSDHVLRNQDGTMALKLTNLDDGTYAIKTYHHDTHHAGTFDLRLTDANMTNQTLFSNVNVELGVNPTKLNTLDFTFEVVENSPVIIYMERKVGISGGHHLSLNGFELELLSSAVPEPGSIFLCILGIVALIRIRR